VTERPRLSEVAAPGWRRWTSLVAIAWALGYGSLPFYWALGTAPSPHPIGTDRVAFTSWGVGISQAQLAIKPPGPLLRLPS